MYSSIKFLLLAVFFAVALAQTTTTYNHGVTLVGQQIDAPLCRNAGDVISLGNNAISSEIRDSVWISHADVKFYPDTMFVAGATFAADPMDWDAKVEFIGNGHGIYILRDVTFNIASYNGVTFSTNAIVDAANGATQVLITSGNTVTLTGNWNGAAITVSPNANLIFQGTCTDCWFSLNAGHHIIGGSLPQSSITANSGSFVTITSSGEQLAASYVTMADAASITFTRPVHLYSLVMMTFAFNPSPANKGTVTAQQHIDVDYLIYYQGDLYAPKGISVLVNSDIDIMEAVGGQLYNGTSHK